MFALTVATCLAVISFADDTRAELDTAIRRREDVLEVAKKVLVDAIDEKIKEAAIGDRLDDVKRLVTDKDNFAKLGLIPEGLLLDEKVQAYIELRKKANSDLAAAYRKVIDAFELNSNRPDAAKTRVEMANFVESEKKILSRRDANPAKPLETKTTKVRVAEFFDAFDRVTEEIDRQVTTAKRQQATRDAEKSLDDRLKGQLWTLRCRITDIQPDRFLGGEGTYSITFESAQELVDVPDGWSSRTGSSMKMSKQEALQVTPGDTFIITGNPRFVWNGRESDSLLTKDRGSGQINLANVKLSIEPAKRPAK